MKILMHLVSGQNLPNYIASKIINPDKELFLFTKGSVGSLKILEDVLPNRLAPVQVDAWDYSAIYESIKMLIEQYKDHLVILNFTGGNKIMSQAAFSAFSSYGKDCIYINSESDEYIYFKGGGVNASVEKKSISIKAGLVDYLKLNGQAIEFENVNTSETQNNLTEFFRKNYKQYAGKVLTIASRYRKNTPLDIQIKEGKLNGSFIRYNNKETTIKFCLNGQETFFGTEKGDKLLEICFGKWFEHVTFNSISSFGIFDDLKLNCHIQRKSDPHADKNELDILGIKGVYPSIFECKSGGIKSEHVDKLVALKQTYLGRYSFVFFITYFPLNDFDEFHLLLKEKMNDNNIIHLSYRDLNKNKLIQCLRKKENLR